MAILNEPIQFFSIIIFASSKKKFFSIIIFASSFWREYRSFGRKFAKFTSKKENATLAESSRLIWPDTSIPFWFSCEFFLAIYSMYVVIPKPISTIFCQLTIGLLYLITQNQQTSVTVFMHRSDWSGLKLGNVCSFACSTT